VDPNLPNNFQSGASGAMVSPDADPEDFIALRGSTPGKLSALEPVSKAGRPEDDRKLLLGGASAWTESNRVQVSPTLLTKRGTGNLLCGPSSFSTNPEVKLPTKRKTRADSPQSHLASSSSAGSTPSVVTHHLQILGDGAFSGHSSMKLRSEGPHASTRLAEIHENYSQDELERMSMGLGTHSNGHDFDESMPVDMSRVSPPISNTLAVIKATAFGALRRNRSQRKRGDNHATKVALEALEARGLGLGLQPTMTLSSAHSMSVGSSADGTRRHSLNLDETLLEDQSM